MPTSADLASPSASVQILLSTFNGERYLDALLQSLFAQTYQNIFIRIRDDGSSDQTLTLLRQYAQRYSNFTVIEGENIGVIQSFFSLIKTCPTGQNQFYAFCDQDDIWQPGKLEAAMHHLNSAQHPASALYSSRLEYVNSQLNGLGYSTIPSYFGFENALVENSAIGCTQVFGEEIRQKILAAAPEQMMMHDWWAYLTASAFGEVIFDAAPGIRYRQHEANVVGWDKRITLLLKKSTGYLRNILSTRNGLQSLQQAEQFLQTYADIPEHKQLIIREVLALRNNSTCLDRCRFLMRSRIRRNHPIENLILTLTILFNLH